MASACARPQLAHTVAGVAATASHGVAPNTVGATTHSVGPAPAGAHHYTAGAVVPPPVNYVAPPAPAPFTTAPQAEGVTTVPQPAPVVTKHVHLGGTSFVAGYATKILKPATPHLPISVPTVLKGSVPYNAPIVKGQIEVHRVQNPGLVERRAEVPCDVPECQENIVKVPTPVHVDAPYNVHVPTKPLKNVYRKLEAPRLAVSATRRLCRCAYTMDSEIKSKEEQWTVKSKAKKNKKKKQEKKPPSL